MNTADFDPPPDDRSNRALPQRLIIAGLLAIMLLGSGLALFIRGRSRPDSAHRERNAGINEGAPAQPGPTFASKSRVSSELHEPAGPVTAVEPSKSTAANLETTNRDARQLVAELAAISDSRDPITKEQADRFKENLAELIRQGTAAIPAIREFLAKNLDAFFVDYQGGDQLGYATLRAALFDALKQIGGPEAQMAMVDALNTTSLPFEILELAKNLEQEAPGLYREQILKATRESLEMAAANLIGSNIEVGPLYRVLENYGGGNAGENVAQSDPLKFQAALALANLPDGQGLSGLMQMAGDSSAGASGQVVATEMIAQMAGQNVRALDALMQMAQNGQIRNAVWQKLAPILAGDEYQLAGPDANSASAPGGPDGAAQVYSVINRATTPEQINQRISLIDRFLAVVGEDSSAAAALRHERGILTGKLQ